METEIRAVLKDAIARRVFPCCVVGVVSKNGERIIVSEGSYTYEPGAQTVEADSVFDVASLTKSIPTACIALKFIEQGKLKLDDKVIDYLPDLDNSHREDILIRHLMTFTIMLDLKSPLSFYKNESPEKILKLIHTTELKHPPGTHYAYSNAPSILLGLVINKISGKPLDILSDELFFKPLGMRHSTFHPTDLATVVPTEIDAWRGSLVHGRVHDESAYILQKKFIPGNAGLFTSVPDLLIFMEMLLNEGNYQGAEYFKKETIDLMHINQLQNIDESAAIGWELNQSRYMGIYSDSDTFGKTGFTGCLVVSHLRKGKAFAMLSNYVYPKRKTDATLINQVRSRISDIVLSE